MKYLITLLLLSGCATHPSRNMQVVVCDPAGTTLSSSEVDSLRSGEIIKKYYVGAYVDPAHPRVRHDPHIVERIEQSSRWNLRPNVPVVASGPTYKAVSSNALKNAMQQQSDHEMQEQRSINSESLAQVSELKKEIAVLKSSLNEQSNQGLKRVEEKIEALCEKVSSLEHPKAQINNLSQSTQSTPTKSPQENKPWEIPIQGE
ncbi:MAG: hypothetical protein FJX18_05515 [Alphaproteobacteria bacterium]|nr:hypothetical protein [Alphaproteobacteria bacterium]